MNDLFSLCTNLLDWLAKQCHTTYRAISVCFNIYLQGGILLIAAIVLLTCITIHKVDSYTEVLLLSFCLAQVVIVIVSFIRYRPPLDYAFDLCVRDLQDLARMLHLSYQALNIIIFIMIYLFCLISDVTSVIYLSSKQTTIEANDLITENISQSINQIDTTANLIVFQSNFSRVELEVGTMPSKDNDSVIFCAAAAFTAQLKDTFAYSNIVGAYITHGKHYNQYACSGKYGRFIYADHQWQFADADNHSLLDSAAAKGGCAFTQWWIIKSGEAIPLARKGSQQNIYRALCEKDGKLMVAQCRKVIPYELFVKSLQAYGIEFALYMDMGSGWNHSFYRDNTGTEHILFPRTHHYCTNWITFYK